MNQLIVIDNTKIKQDSQGRYCLNDLHRASGGNPIHAPSQFLRLKGTKDFVSVLDNHNANLHSALEIINGGTNQGCYAVEKLVYKYAAWINPEFEVKVYDTFDKVVKGKLQQNPTALLPQNYAAALRELAESVEREEVLKLENKQQADCIEAMSNYFRAGMTAPQFVKGLNGVNSTQINAFLQKKNWLYRDQRGEWRVTSYARDVYMTEEVNEFTPHGCDPIIKYKPTLLKKGAAKLYEWYAKGLLPMKTTWNGKFIQEKVAA